MQSFQSANFTDKHDDELLGDTCPGSPTFDRLDIALTALDLLQRRILRLEPIRNDQLPAPGLQHPRGIPEEQRLVREMAERLGDPHGVEGRRVEASLHLLGVELQEPYLAAFGAQSVKRWRFRRRCRSWGFRCRTSIAAGLFVGQTVRDRDLASADGDAGDGASQLAGEMTRRAADAAADVENFAVGLQVGDREEELDQVDLPGLLRVVCGLEVRVVDMLAPRVQGGVC